MKPLASLDVKMVVACVPVIPITDRPPETTTAARYWEAPCHDNFLLPARPCQTAYASLRQTAPGAKCCPFTCVLRAALSCLFQVTRR